MHLRLCKMITEQESQLSLYIMVAHELHEQHCAHEKSLPLSEPQRL